MGICEQEGIVIRTAEVLSKVYLNLMKMSTAPAARNFYFI